MALDKSLLSNSNHWTRCPTLMLTCYFPIGAHKHHTLSPPYIPKLHTSFSNPPIKTTNGVDSVKVLIIKQIWNSNWSDEIIKNKNTKKKSLKQKNALSFISTVLLFFLNVSLSLSPGFSKPYISRSLFF